MEIASACLVGQKCRYDGQAAEDAHIKKLYEQGELIEVCPEMLAGLLAPRSPCEIIGGDGSDVLRGKAKVMDKDGIDQTAAFIKGAHMALAIAKESGAKCAYLKSKSPSCGCGMIYDGSFLGKMVNGDGVATALFKQNGIKVIQV